VCILLVIRTHTYISQFRECKDSLNVTKDCYHLLPDIDICFKPTVCRPYGKLAYHGFHLFLQIVVVHPHH
jgi:hypothetical protein